ncbi:PLDc N-terminal domain-containing protein [Streptomyces sp. NPDC005811]|uniref:PLDc N-terminal domain-containing protein n=1 Tax=Streptomyces sp. NPDC005811 TaxID=3154565 RepID=UPI0033E66A95
MLQLMDLPVLVLIVLVAAITVWALIDCIRTPREHVRFLPKLLWLLILLHGSVCAALIWTYFGKKQIANAAQA